MKCPSCGNRIPKGAAACPACGATVTAKTHGKKCPFCRSKLERGNHFCNECGARVMQKRPSRTAILALILAVAVLLCAVDIAAWQLEWFPSVSAWVNSLVTGDSGAEAVLNEKVVVFSADETDRVEGAILSAVQTDNELVLDVQNGSPMDSLKRGSLFLLQGADGSSFGNAYFGKVISREKEDGHTVYSIETPTIDEVFDRFDLDLSQALTYETLSEVIVMDGVTVCDGSALSADSVLQSGSFSSLGVTQLASTGSPIRIDGTLEKDDIGLNIEIDILKLLEQWGKDPASTSQNEGEKVSKEQSAATVVYYTDTGVCYHTGNCRYLWNSKHETYLANAKSTGLRPCTVCDPPTEEEDSEEDGNTPDYELKLTGSVGIRDLAFGVYSEGEVWNSEKGYENMSIHTEGDFYADVTLTGNCELTFGQDETKLVVNGFAGTPLLTLEGLKEKLLPFAFLTWDCGVFKITDAPGKNDVANAPISVGILFYTDLYGNISIGAELQCSYTCPIDNDFDILKDGKFLGVGAKDGVTEEDIAESDYQTNWRFCAEVEGDVTLHAMSASLMLYVGNVNILEFSVARLGMNANGAIGFDSEKLDNESYGFYAEGTVRLYLQFAELNMKLKAEALGAELELGYTLGPWQDYTLWSLRKQTERDVVLVLDVSGSMEGTPIAEAKNSALEFIDTVLEEDASIAVVTYNYSAAVVSDFSTDKTHLTEAVESIYAYGGTNIESGLSSAERLLADSKAKKKIIVLLSDGLPNNGLTDDALIAYADTVKEQDIYIYTLGFFQSMSGSEKVSAQQLMQGIASDGMHYEVSGAQDLVFFFGDLADQINGQKYIYIRIACPVDVTVRFDGERLCSKETLLSTRTDFGTLTFEENDKESDSGGDNRIKVLRLKEGADYEIKIEGNGRGSMDYTIGFMDENGEYSDLRRFKNIKITKNTKINTVASRTEETYLYVDEDGDGKTDYTYLAAEDSRAALVEEKGYLLPILLCCAGILLVGAGIAAVIIGKKKKKAGSSLSETA